MAGPATKLTTETRQVYYDVQAVRADFPIFSVRPYGKELIYLDNAASAQKPRPVLERMQRAYESEYANVHRGLYYLAHCSTEAYEAARKKIQLFLNAEAAEEIVFTRSATESINLIASSFGQMAIQEGDEIILSVLEHHSNIVPWHFLREQKGAKLIWIGLDESQKFNLDQFAAAFNKHTKLVALTHMSNVLGTILPVKEIIRIAHDHHVPVLLDGSQACVHMKVDVQHLDADFYVATGHKLYGPTGIGILYGKKKMVRTAAPF